MIYLSKMKTVDIKGKAYVTVNERIKYFREHFEGYSLRSEFPLDEIIRGETIIIKAVIRNPEGIIVSEGTAFEVFGSTFINKTSFVENCETSAWGRALANFGIGVDSSVASADEVANAIKQKETKLKQK